MSRLSFSLAATGIAAVLLLELLHRLSAFPALHGDEAWVGLRALDILANGASSINGMNTYSGAVFPQLVAAVFSLHGASVMSLRLPGTILNSLAVGILAITFWRRGQTALYIVLLFASSLFFLFYSRIAWEVTALENLLISITIASTASVLIATKLRKAPTALYFAVFTVGTLNHFIFAAAAVSFVITAGLIASKSVNSQTSRLLLMGLFNIPLQIVVMVSKQFILDGPFTTHALPALIAGGFLVLGTTIGFIRAEPIALRQAKRLYAQHPWIPGRVHKYLFYTVANCFLLVLPFNGVSFFGMISGYIVMERVASHVPTVLESIGIYLKTGALIFAFGRLVYRHNKENHDEPFDVLKGFLLAWPIVFLIAMQVETLGLSDRYFILPQAMFFAALALSVKRSTSSRYINYAGWVGCRIDPGSVILLARGEKYFQSTTTRLSLWVLF